VTCAKCRFSMLPESDDSSSYLQCHRYAPRPLVDQQAPRVDPDWMNVVWPEVPMNGWCGEFEARDA
jgi:hypothetical protein